jgi:hypothetical protein
MKAIPKLQDIYTLQENINRIENEVYLLQQRIFQSKEGQDYENNRLQESQDRLSFLLNRADLTSSELQEIEDLKNWIDLHNRGIQEYQWDIDRFTKQIEQKLQELNEYKIELVSRGRKEQVKII